MFLLPLCKTNCTDFTLFFFLINTFEVQLWSGRVIVYNKKSYEAKSSQVFIYRELQGVTMLWSAKSACDAA